MCVNILNVCCGFMIVLSCISVVGVVWFFVVIGIRWWSIVNVSRVDWFFVVLMLECCVVVKWVVCMFVGL